jgi:hypothetical protein
MALLHLLSEEEIAEDRLERYFGQYYRVVCIGARSEPPGDLSQPVRTTYIVDWEQLVHLLEGYEVLDEDIVEVSPVSTEEDIYWRACRGSTGGVAQA